MGMDRSEQDKKKLIQECRYLYRNSIIVYLILTAYFAILGVELMLVLNIVGLLIFTVGFIRLRKTTHVSTWILMITITLIAHSMCGNLVLGWGYGFAAYGLMMIPVTFFFTYQDAEISNMTNWAIGLAAGAFLSTVLSCGIFGAYNKVDGVPEWMITVVFLTNVTVSAISLIRYSYEFLKENIAKTVSLAFKNAELDFRANYDSLTRLYNRELFMEQVDLLLHLYADTKFSMVVSDIKDFKIINDLYGNTTGDRLLMTEADLLRMIAGEMSVYGRIGADKFAICLPTERCEDALFVKGIEKMKAAFAENNYKLFIYVGIYEIEDCNEKATVMCDKATLALQSIKGDYHKVVAHYENSLLDKELSDRKMLGEFEQALEQGQFCIYLQPQTLQDGKVCGAEALVRWQHPENGLVMPGAFIPCFEQAGLIYRLDCFVWEQAAKQLKQWHDMGRDDLHISVNISAKDFYFVDVYDTIMDLVEKYEIDCERLRLEITETALAVNFNEILEILKKLHEKGFIIEIDDFGSGYSSFNMLKDVCADVIKIDREFLRETQNAKRSKDILEGIIALSTKMNMDVITEGVETREQVDMLTTMGCKLFQGYYFSKPISLTEFEMKYEIG